MARKEQRPRRGDDNLPDKIRESLDPERRGHFSQGQDRPGQGIKPTEYYTPETPLRPDPRPPKKE